MKGIIKQITTLGNQSLMSLESPDPDTGHSSVTSPRVRAYPPTLNSLAPSGLGVSGTQKAFSRGLWQ